MEPIRPLFAAFGAQPESDQQAAPPPALSFPGAASFSFSSFQAPATMPTQISFPEKERAKSPSRQKEESRQKAKKEERRKDGSGAKHKKEKKKKHKKKHSKESSDSGSSDSDSSDSKREKKRRKEKKEKKEKEEKKPDKKEAREEIFVGGREAGFIVDKRGDRDNVKYDSIYKGNIPNYIRKFGNTVLAEDGALLIAKFDDGRTRKRPWLGDTEISQRSKRYCYAPLVDKDDVIPIVPSRPTNQDVESEFVPLTTAVVEPVTSAPQEGEGVDGEAAKVEDPLQATNREYNQMLRGRPQDVDLWLEYIAYQAAIPPPPGQRQRKSAMRVLKERQLSIYERALQQNKGNLRLLLGWLETGEDLWPSDTLMAHWKAELFSHATSPRFWTAYLDMRERAFSLYVCLQLLAEYGNAVATLAAVRDGTFTAVGVKHVQGVQNAGLEGDVVALFHRAVRAQWEAGHTEGAIACYQAQIEFNCYPPIGKGVAQAKEFFEPFWDSEVPRFGEDGARGWFEWTEMRGEGSDMTGGGYEQREVPEREGEVLRDKWVRVERWRETEECLPWHAGLGKCNEEDDDPEDPDRWVSYDDVESFLFHINSNGEKEGLIHHLLSMVGVGLPPIGPSAQFADSFRHVTDPAFLFAPIKGVIETAQPLVYDPILGYASPPAIQSEPLVKFVRNVFAQAQVLFPDSLVLAIAQINFEKTEAVHRASTPKERKSNLKGVVKLAKGLLQKPQHRNRLRLWHTYAMLEAERGQHEDVRKVYAAAVAMAGSVPELADDLALAYRCAVEFELSVGAADRALNLLAALADPTTPPNMDGPPPSGPRLLKVRRDINARLKTALEQAGATAPPSSSDAIGGPSFVHWIVCGGLLEYLSTGVTEANRTFSQSIQSIFPKHVLPLDLLGGSTTGTAKNISKNGNGMSAEDEKGATKGSDWQRGVKAKEREEHSWGLELVVVRWVQLLHVHTVQSRLPASGLRSLLDHAARCFPANPYILSVFTYHELTSRGTARVRPRFDHLLTAEFEAPALTWMFAVACECLHEEPRPARLHSLFERFDTQQHVRGSAAIWHMAIRMAAGLRPDNLPGKFTNRRQDKGQGVIGMLYRAIQRCPGIKSLYTAAISHLPASGIDWEIAVDLVQEKELRLRTPLEEVELL